MSWLGGLFKGVGMPQAAPSPLPLPSLPNLPKPGGNPGQLLIDLYHGDFDGRVPDFATAKAKGNVVGLYHKATEGASVTDMTLAPRVKAARAAGLAVTAYHFFRGNVDPEAQAEHFLKAVGGITWDMPFVMDWETKDGMPREVHIERGQTFLDTVEKASGHVPFIYLNEAQALFLDLPASFARYPLLFAHYGLAAVPPAPSPWPSLVAWQNSDTATVPGMPGECDTNILQVPLAKLLLP